MASINLKTQNKWSQLIYYKVIQTIVSLNQGLMDLSHTSNSFKQQCESICIDDICSLVTRVCLQCNSQILKSCLLQLKTNKHETLYTARWNLQATLYITGLHWLYTLWIILLGLVNIYSTTQKIGNLLCTQYSRKKIRANKNKYLGKWLTDSRHMLMTDMWVFVLFSLGC